MIPIEKVSKYRLKRLSAFLICFEMIGRQIKGDKNKTIKINVFNVFIMSLLINEIKSLETF